MDINNFSDIEELINRKVNSAMSCVNMAMDKMSNAENILNDVVSSVKDKTEVIGEKINNIKEEAIAKRNNTSTAAKYITKKPKGRVKGVFLSVTGKLGVGVGLILLLIGFLVSSITATKVLYIIGGLFVVTNIISILRGNIIRARIRRFRRYVEYINNKHYCEIKKLSEGVDKSRNFVIKDLRKMIDLEMFKEAHIDSDNSYLILGNKIYEEYLLMKESYNNRKSEEKRANEEAKKEEVNDDTIVKSELDMVIEAGEKYIEEIKYANIYIQEENMTAKLNKLEGILREIFITIRKNPEKVNDVRKVINHYLPITSKLVNSYKDLNNQSIVGENIKKAKTEIEESIDLINNAFERLLDDLFEEVAMDISSDISVLKTLFAQEGLTEEDFKKN